MRKTKLTAALAAIALMAVGAFFSYRHYMAPTRILVVNALRTQQADIVTSNDSRHIKVKCVEAEQMEDLADYDAVVLYGRRLSLTDSQLAELRERAEKGLVVFTKQVKSSSFTENHNIEPADRALLQEFFENDSRQNFRNGLRCLRHIATPYKWGDQEYERPVDKLNNIFYHRAYGHYFDTPQQLAEYLRKNRLYHEGGQNIALISGITFPTEGNREHVDTLISLLTARGFNVFPFAAVGKKREAMLRALKPDAVVYMPMGRLGNDSLLQWVHQNNIALFCPFPVAMTHKEWMDKANMLTSGTKNSRIVIPEIDGATAPFCIATQNPDKEGYYRFTAEVDRCLMLVDHIERTLALRTKSNRDKRVAIGYFKRPGKDALLASGMEVIPSLYNFLKRLQQEGYNVNGLPASLAEFARQVKTEGIVLGSYAKGAQQEYMRKGHPQWIKAALYEQWAHEVLPKEQYNSVVSHYGKAPGSLLTRGDSIAVACLRYGNVLLFPQPRPALGDDDFKLVHGVDVPPPHSYLAPYLYVQKGFKADALIHFGTHGNLEFTPGRDAGMRADDWSSQLIGPLPHFYFYTTGNVGEAIIAKRRSRAVLLTYLTPPYAESGMRQKYEALLAKVHRAVDGGCADKQLLLGIKSEVVRQGLHRDLQLDSTLSRPYTAEEMQRIDAHLEELANERMQGAYYTMGVPYSEQDLYQTVMAMEAEPLAFELARTDCEKGRITARQQQDYAFVAHHYLPKARQQVKAGMAANDNRRLLVQSTQNEFDAMVRALGGGNVAPVPGGDPVLNPNVLPTGRNMFSINPDNTPDPQAWEDGKRLAENTLSRYRSQHHEWPRKVSYTLWAGEFIATQGATVAQALWMLGVEPVRDSEGRIATLRLIPARQLGRPRINVVVQVSGQLRDIADSRLKLITKAVKMASEDVSDSNFVHQGTVEQEKQLVENGMPPKRAREMATMRVFGPVNGGYSTGMMNYIERSGSWTDRKQLVEGYLNNMGAAYGDDDNWGVAEEGLFAAALQQTDLVVQPRQSNTWGPVSLDHVYEFTGGLSLAVKTLTGKEPDALMADYRNRANRRMQDLNEAIAVEVRTTVLNPAFVKERMKGDEGTAQMFGEVFRNIFGWNATRPTALDPQLYNDLYRMYVADENQLGVRNFFQEKNPAAYQAMTAVLLESARKGFWKPSADQLKQTAGLHAQITAESGAACTDFVCNNAQLQQFVAGNLPQAEAKAYNRSLQQVKSAGSGQKSMVLDEEGAPAASNGHSTWIAVGVVLLALVLLAVVVARLRKRQ